MLGAHAPSIVAAVLIGVGALFVFAGQTLAPEEDADARAFGSDPSCAAGTVGRAPAGACTWESVTIVAAETRASDVAKRRSQQPYVTFRRADGTVLETQLAGAAGRRFALNVRSGAAARVLLFHSTPVRVVAGTEDAQTLRAPNVESSNLHDMMWVGTGALVIGVVIGGVATVGRIRARRR